MAELRVEKRKPVWPWIMAVLLIIGVAAWILVERGDVRVTDDGQIHTRDTEQRDTYDDRDVTTSR